MKYFALILSPFLIISALMLLISKSGNEKTPGKPVIIRDSIKNQNNNMDIFSPISKFKNLNEDFVKLHFDAVTVDSHNDFLYQAYNKDADLEKGTMALSPIFRSLSKEV